MILLQDMSKVYDHVNIFMLIRALERLKLPKEFIYFVLNMFISRNNQVFTAFENTDTYKVFSGIDQGEILSPLLWCIYYDPLLYRVQSSDFGYTMLTRWKPNVRSNSFDELQCKTSV